MSLARSRNFLRELERLQGYSRSLPPTCALPSSGSVGVGAFSARSCWPWTSNAIYTSLGDNLHSTRHSCSQVNNRAAQNLLTSPYADQLKFPTANSIVYQTSLCSGFHSDTGTGVKSSVTAPAASPPASEPTPPSKSPPAIRENIYTLPNFLTSTRILLCPLLAYTIIHENYLLSSATLLYCGLSDWIDGRLARMYPKKMSSVLGTILDPAADKILMTTLVISLGWKELLPLPLAILIVGRDVLLALSALYFRYQSLPPPKTFNRFWDFSLPSAEVKPTQISKLNTFLQLSLVGLTTISPIVPHDLSTPLTILQWTVAFTTLASGLSYMFSKDAIRYLK